MKTIIFGTVAIALCPLTTSSIAATGPSKLPKGAEAGMWTTTPIPRVTACIARVLNAPANGNTITAADGTRYEITEPTRKNTVYTTQVSRFGSLPNDEIGTAIALCA